MEYTSAFGIVVMGRVFWRVYGVNIAIVGVAMEPFGIAVEPLDAGDALRS